MQKMNSRQLLEQLQADVRKIITQATFLKTQDPGLLLKQPTTGKWSVIQVLEHLNTYSDYYLVAIERSLQQEQPAVVFFKPGWLGNYFTRLMKPDNNGKVNNKMRSPKNHRPQELPDAFPVLKKFIRQQQYLLELLELAKTKNIGQIRTPISLSKLIKLKVGDVFRFLIAHEQRHFVQVSNTLEMITTPGYLQQEMHAA